MPVTYWDLVLPTYIENWDAGLYNLSIPHIDIPITVADARGITDLVWDNKPYDLNPIANKLDEAIAKMPNGAFVRLGSRSPKDAGLSLKSMDSRHALSLLLNSERAFDDLCLAVKHDYNPHIWARQWVDIPKETEFRCFMKNRSLVGISQYYYFDGKFEFIHTNSATIKWSIEQFFKTFVEACHLNNVVFDVYLKNRTRDNETTWEVRLLEINPFFELTDPCLFHWSKPEEFDGGFKYIQ